MKRVNLVIFTSFMIVHQYHQYTLKRQVSMLWSDIKALKVLKC